MGKKDILWRGEVQWFAKSSGTTNDKSKFIPVSRDGLHDIHYAGGMDAVALYLQQNPESRFFSGKGLILGGSHAPNYNVKRSLVGDLSAILIENVNPLVNLIRVPEKKIALLSDFEEKVERITRATMNQNVTNLSGVPSWMMAVLKHILEVKGTDNLVEVWPNLEVFFHGGLLLLLIANNINSLFVVTRCIIWKHTMPVKVFSDYKMTSVILPCY